eukprot:1805415-Amphidinium_carterae.1
MLGEGPSELAVCPARCVSNGISGSELLAPVVWEINSQELTGEIRLELHRDNLSKRPALACMIRDYRPLYSGATPRESAFLVSI